MFQQMWHKYGIGCIFAAVAGLYVVNMMVKYLSGRGILDMDTMGGASAAMGGGRDGGGSGGGGGLMSGGPQPAQPGNNEMFASAQGGSDMVIGSGGGAGMQNPADLLPVDTNSQWAQLNPSGAGELANINLLTAGSQIGIDTIGQSFRNPNLQLRSEPPNPRYNTGIWNQSTIVQDNLRPSLEIGQ